MTQKPVTKERAEAGTAPEEKQRDGTSGDVPFEKLLERLGQVADHLEKSDVPLEKALALFEEGVGLVRGAEARLAQAEARIEELVQSGETRPLDDGKKR